MQRFTTAQSNPIAAPAELANIERIRQQAGTSRLGQLIPTLPTIVAFFSKRASCHVRAEAAGRNPHDLVSHLEHDKVWCIVR